MFPRGRGPYNLQFQLCPDVGQNVNLCHKLKLQFCFSKGKRKKREKLCLITLTTTDIDFKLHYVFKIYYLFFTLNIKIIF